MILVVSRILGIASQSPQVLENHLPQLQHMKNALHLPAVPSTPTMHGFIHYDPSLRHSWGSECE